MNPKLHPLLLVLFVLLLPQIPAEATDKPIASVSYEQAPPVEKGKKKVIVPIKKKKLFKNNKSKNKRSKPDSDKKKWVPILLGVLGSVLLVLAALWGYYFFGVLMLGWLPNCGFVLFTIFLGIFVYILGALLLALLGAAGIALIVLAIVLDNRFKKKAKIWEDKPEGRNNYEAELDKEADENFPLLPLKIRRAYVNAQVSITELEKKATFEKAKFTAKYPNSKEESQDVLILKQRIREQNERLELIENLYANIEDIHPQKCDKFFDLKLRLLKLEQEQTQLLGKKDRRSLGNRADIERKTKEAQSELDELMKEE